jgi:hypothetical protein
MSDASTMSASTTNWHQWFHVVQYDPRFQRAVATMVASMRDAVTSKLMFYYHLYQLRALIRAKLQTPRVPGLVAFLASLGMERPQYHLDSVNALTNWFTLEEMKHGQETQVRRFFQRLCANKGVATIHLSNLKLVAPRLLLLRARATELKVDFVTYLRRQYLFKTAADIAKALHQEFPEEYHPHPTIHSLVQVRSVRRIHRCNTLVIVH